MSQWSLAFGDAKFFGSLSPAGGSVIVGIIATRTSATALSTAQGNATAFGTAPAT